MNLEEIEAAVVDMPIVSGVCPTGGGLVREDILWLIAEVKRLRAEIDERYLCPECGYTWSTGRVNETQKWRRPG